MSLIRSGHPPELTDPWGVRRGLPRPQTGRECALGARRGTSTEPIHPAGRRAVARALPPFERTPRKPWSGLRGHSLRYHPEPRLARAWQSVPRARGTGAITERRRDGFRAFHVAAWSTERPDPPAGRSCDCGVKWRDYETLCWCGRAGEHRECVCTGDGRLDSDLNRARDFELPTCP